MKHNKVLTLFFLLTFFFLINCSNKKTPVSNANSLALTLLLDFEESSSSPTAPTNLKASAITHNQVTLTWTKGGEKDNVTYEVSTDGTWGKYKDITKTSYTVTNLTANTNYTLQVRAFTSKSVSNSISVTITTKTDVSYKTMEAFDANNTRLGYVTNVDKLSLTIHSDKDYIYSLQWDGAIQSNISLYSTERNGGGSVFMLSMLPPYAKSIYSLLNGSLYTPADINQNTSTPDTKIISGKSIARNGQNFINSSSTVDPKEKAYKLKAITRAEVGIPTTIKIPISIRYK